MRRTTAILTVCLCALAGCQGGGAQEPYDGVLAAARRPMRAAVVVPQAPEAAPIASEVDVPWSIALLSDAKRPRPTKHGKAILANTGPGAAETIAEDTNLHVAIDPRSAEDKAATPKTCSGVVKSRS